MLDQAVGDGEKGFFDFLAGDFVAGNAEDSGGTMGKHDQGVSDEGIIFRIAAKAVGELSHEPGAARAGKFGMENVAPGVEQELIFVRALFDEFEVATANFFD